MGFGLVGLRGIHVCGANCDVLVASGGLGVSNLAGKSHQTFPPSKVPKVQPCAKARLKAWLATLASAIKKQEVGPAQVGENPAALNVERYLDISKPYSLDSSVASLIVRK